MDASTIRADHRVINSVPFHTNADFDSESEEGDDSIELLKSLWKKHCEDELNIYRGVSSMASCRKEKLPNGKFKYTPQCPLRDWWLKDGSNGQPGGMRHTFPTVYKLAKKYLAIPASSASAERAFSISGNIITALRSQLSAKNVGSLHFVHENYEYCTPCSV